MTATPCTRSHMTLGIRPRAYRSQVPHTNCPEFEKFYRLSRPRAWSPRVEYAFFNFAVTEESLRIRVGGVSHHLEYTRSRLLTFSIGSRKVDIRLPGKWNSNSHGARPVHQKHRWIRTSRLSIRNSLSFYRAPPTCSHRGLRRPSQRFWYMLQFVSG